VGDGGGAEGDSVCFRLVGLTDICMV
jgi:hypothetical protein